MDYAYFPGCSLESTGKPYDVSLRRVFDRLGIGLTEIDDWNCCGATSYIAMNKLAAYSISARNLARAESMGQDVCAPCSSCYTILSKVNRHIRWGEEHKTQINEVLAAAGLRYDGGREVLHPLDILVRRLGTDAIRPKVVRPLAGFRVAPYYGCQIVRPMGRFDDPEQPVTLDELFTAVGAEVVPFAAKVQCCGGLLMTIYEDVALKLNRDILDTAAAAGANVIVTTCPLCQINLEAFQERINRTFGTDHRMPIVYFTQLLGVALGFSPAEMQLDRLMVPVAEAYLETREVRA